MEPLDEEAEAVTETFRARWASYCQFDPVSGDFSQSLIKGLTEQIDRLTSQREPIPSTAIPATVSREDFVELQKQVAALMARNAQLESNTL
jgi:hypothetical protein